VRVSFYAAASQGKCDIFHVPNPKQIGNKQNPSLSKAKGPLD
jgi:hypothetical protein